MISQGTGKEVDLPAPFSVASMAQDPRPGLKTATESDEAIGGRNHRQAENKDEADLQTPQPQASEQARVSRSNEHQSRAKNAEPTAQ